MPYVQEDIQEYLDKGGFVSTAGQLNYKITKLLIDYLENNTITYKNINDCLGALEGAKAEFYRRVAVPYENSKMMENDVYRPFMMKNSEIFAFIDE